ncbi:LacI family DNA-binding transcriptional regulator [Oscillospiraceae bacterium PP1C4]
MTIRDIAKAAGVSPATVSLVLNNKSGVSEERRQVIQRLLTQNGYEKRCHDKSSLNILFVKYVQYGTIVEHNGDFINRVLDGLQDEADKLRINLTMRNLNSHHFDEIMDCFKTGGYHGSIILGTELDDAFAQKLEHSPIPTVVLDNMVENYELDSVVMDNRGCAFSGVRYLIECGHRKIGFVKSKYDISNFHQRYEGYRSALEKHDIPFEEKYVFEVEPTMHGAYHDMLNALSKGRELPTSFFAGNDSMGAGVVKALKQYSYRVPEQISMIGIDDLPFCSISDPMLTTMAIPKETMGRMAVRRMYEKVLGDSQECIKKLLYPHLVERESVAKL